MKINHALIRQILQILGISIFLVSIFFKLKDIILMGGTKSITDEINDGSEETVDITDEEEYPEKVAVEPSVQTEN